ncbi:hypothetical protein CQA53_09850, partial [Helicobacter didelphidarum]
MEKIKKISLICQKNKLINEITTYTKNAKKIALHCSNFHKPKNIYSPVEELALEDWLWKYLSGLKGIEVEIHNYNSINQENITKSSKEERNKNLIIYNKKSELSDILFNFVKQLNKDKDENKNDKKDKDEDEKNLSKAIHKFLEQQNSIDKLTSCIETYLKKPLIKKLKEFEETKFFADEKRYEESLEQIFDELIQDIKAIHKEGNAQAYKEIVNLFFSIFNIFDIKKALNKSNMALNILFEGSRTLFNILEWVDSQYSFAISNSVIKLFVQDIAPIISLFDNHILNYTLIIDDRILIEISGFKRNITESKAYIKQDLALLIELEEKNLVNIQDINLRYEHQSENLQICDKKNITDYLITQMSLSNNRLSYIESPYFNSSKLVKLIKNEEDTTIKPSEQGYNYLIISNAPYKHNAGLNEKLLEKLGNVIFYGDDNNKEIKSDSLFKNPQDYNTIIDYSKYKINIKDEANQPYVVSLSPFVFVPQKEYENYQFIKEEFDRFSSNLLTEDKYLIEQYFDFKRKNNDKIPIFDFIENFFQQENNKKDFLKQEKKYFKESIKCLQGYIDSLIKVLVTYEYNYYEFGYEIPIQEKQLKPKKEYSVLEMLLLALTYYVIKNFYTSIETDIKSWWFFNPHYERIEIDKESLTMLPYDAFLVLKNNKIPLCFSTKRKEKLLENHQEVFCIEEFVIKLDNQEDTDEIDVDKVLKEFFKEEDFKDELKNLNDNNLDDLDILAKELQNLDEKLQKEKSQEHIKTSESLLLIVEEFITSFFPFASLIFNLNPFNLSKKLVKLLISYKTNHLREVLFGELGLAYLAYILYNHDMKIHIQTYKRNRTLDRKFERLKKKSFVQAVKQVQNSVATISQKDHIKDLKQIKGQDLKYYKNIFLKDYTKDTIKDFFKSIPQSIGLNIFNQVFITEYEKSKKEFERLKFAKLSYKYHPPYVLKKHNEGVFYPMLVNNTFLSFNFINMIIGGRLKTGALGDIDSLFYCYEGKNTKNTRNYLLNKLLSYLCLDELRVMNDNLTPLNDIEFFNTRAYTKDLQTRPRFLKLKHDEGEFTTPPHSSKQIKENLAKFNKTMQNINEDKRKEALYNQYSPDSSNGLNAIDAYHTAMNYLDDVYMGSFNTNLKDNKPNSEKHREFLKSLNTIGLNNIRAMYEG